MGIKLRVPEDDRSQDRKLIPEQHSLGLGNHEVSWGGFSDRRCKVRPPHLSCVVKIKDHWVGSMPDS